MKKILFLFVLGIFVFGFHNAQASTIEDLQKQVQGLIESVNSIKDTTVKTESIVLENTPIFFTRTLKPGHEGNDVKALQVFLGMPAIGKFDTQTQEKLIYWQKANGLTPDGIFGVIGQSKISSVNLIKKQDGSNTINVKWKELNLVTKQPLEKKASQLVSSNNEALLPVGPGGGGTLTCTATCAGLNCYTSGCEAESQAGVADCSILDCKGAGCIPEGCSCSKTTTALIVEPKAD